VAQFFARIVFKSGSIQERRATEDQIKRLFDRDQLRPRLLHYVLGVDVETGELAAWHHPGSPVPFSPDELRPCRFRPGHN
jgi:hypothetical protein